MLTSRIVLVLVSAALGALASHAFSRRAVEAAGQRPPADPPSAATTRRVPQFENDQVRVWKSIIMPRQPLSMHRHDHPRVIVALVGGSLKVVKQSGESSWVNWETGNAYWLSADPPGELHGDVNEGNRPIEVTVIEVRTAQ